MQPEALATLLGLAAAVYALLPERRRLDLRLLLDTVDWLVLWTAILLVHYILLLPVLHSIHMAPHLGPWRWGFTSETASYFTLLVAIIFVGTRASRATLSRSNIPRLRELLENLLYQRRYADLISLLDRHLHTLCRTYKNEYWLPRLRDRLDPPNLLILTQPERQPSPVVRRLARLLPQYRGAPQEAAKSAVRCLLLMDDFVRYLAEIQPDLGLRILEQEIEEGENFQSLWITALLENKNSALYYEVTDAATEGALRAGNRILHFYLDDVQRARALLLNKALGDYVIAKLDHLHGLATTHRYNQPNADFDSRPRVEDPVYAALIIYERMVSAAIDQELPWSRPLAHFIPFADRITRNLAPEPQVDLTGGRPTPYHFFLYKMVSWLLDWIKTAQGFPDQQAVAALQVEDVRHGTGDIPKHFVIPVIAILTLGRVSKTIMSATTIDDHFKAYLLEAICRLEGEPYENNPLHPFGDLVLESLVLGGDDCRFDHANAKALRSVIPLVDTTLRPTTIARLEKILDEKA